MKKIKRGADETEREFNQRVTHLKEVRKRQRDGVDEDKKAQRKASAELVDKIAKDVRKERKKREAAEDARAEMEYENEGGKTRKAAKRLRLAPEAEAKKAIDPDRWDYKVTNGIAKRVQYKKTDGNGIINASELVKIVATVAGTGLDLNCLRLANIARSESKNGFRHPLDLWSIAEWTNALQAEAGEAGNFAKKILRLRLHSRGNKKGDRNEGKLLKRLTQEVADAVVYADLCLASEGISLSDAVRDTFNRKSKEIGFKFKL